MPSSLNFKERCDILKKILVINGSRNKKGNTQFFIKNILADIEEDFNVEWLYPQDYNLYPVFDTFSNNYNEKDDDFYMVKEKILNSNLLIISSPVYMHAMSSDIKLLLERFSTWAHILRLNGKPCVIVSTCESNGQDTVIEPLSKCITNMGGNIIATANASILKELKHPSMLKEIANEISNRILNFINVAPQSNKFIERNFKVMKKIMNYRINEIKNNDYQKLNHEEKYWIESKLLYQNNFEEFIKSIKL